MNGKYSKPQHPTSDLQSNKESQTPSLRQSMATTSQSNTIYTHTHRQENTLPYSKSNLKYVISTYVYLSLSAQVSTGEEKIRMT